MKKILIATSALAAFAATSAFALDVTTSGAVEYRYTKDKAANKAQNPKLSHKTSEVKFAAEGASNGLAYGAWVKVKNGGGAAYAAAKDASSSETLDGSNLAVTAAGWASDGAYSGGISKDGAVNAVFVKHTPGTSVTQGAPANNATTQSAMWVSGSFGKVTIGQAGSAAGDHAIDGAVNAAGFSSGDHVAEAGADTASGERITYTAPSLVDGLSFAYTTTFKGNAGKKEDKATAASNWAIAYSTDVAGVSLSVAHAQGKTAGKKNETITLNPTSNGAHDTLTVTKKNGARTNTQTGMTLGYGNFTVGYGVFNNGKKFNQTKDTSGSNYGVKYASGAWAVGYTVKKSEDNNKYTDVKKQSASTSAYSASYTVAEGFSVYASKSSNSVKKDATTTKKNFTIIGAKVSF